MIESQEDFLLRSLEIDDRALGNFSKETIPEESSKKKSEKIKLKLENKSQEEFKGTNTSDGLLKEVTDVKKTGSKLHLETGVNDKIETVDKTLKTPVVSSGKENESTNILAKTAINHISSQEDSLLNSLNIVDQESKKKNKVQTPINTSLKKKNPSSKEFTLLKSKKKFDIKNFIKQDISKLTFVGDLKSLKALKHPLSVVVSGNLVFPTMDKSLVPGKSFIQQDTRLSETFPNLALNLLKKKTPGKVYIWIENSIFATQSKLKANIKWQTTVDYYLQWGLAQKKPVILCGGYETINSLNIEVFRFLAGELKEIKEFEMSSFGGLGSFQSDLVTKIKEWQDMYPDYKICWARPLLKRESLQELVTDIGYEPFERRTFRLLEKPDKNKKKSRKEKILIFLVCIMSILTYSGFLFKGYSKYQNEVVKYQEVMQRYVEKYQNEEDNLEILGARQNFLSKANPQVKRSQFLRQLINSTSSISDASIKEINIVTNPSNKGGKKAKERDRTFSLKIIVPTNKRQNALEQAKPILVNLAKKIGTSIYLETHRKIGTTDNPSREFTISGLMPKRIYIQKKSPSTKSKENSVKALPADLAYKKTQRDRIL